MRTARQTDRQTETLITILRTAARGVTAKSLRARSTFSQ